MQEPKAQPIFTKEDVTHIFNHLNRIKVVFEKKDGSLRTMLCTRNFNTIPEGYRPHTEGQIDRPGKPTPEHLFSVFDLDANGWRSFVPEKVLSIYPAA